MNKNRKTRSRWPAIRRALEAMHEYAVAVMLVAGIAGIGILHFALIFTWIGGR